MGLIEKYLDLMPPEIQAIPKENIVTLGEGSTPLWRADRLKEYLNEKYGRFESDIYLKDEGKNYPTGSFKDRGMTTAVSYEKFLGRKAEICASTGNTLAAAATFCARAGIKLFGLLPDGKVALGKISQAFACGAEVIKVRGNFDEAFRIVKEIVAKNPDIGLLNSLNPNRMPGQMTGAYEICDKLGRAPTYHYIPVGNAGNITAYWWGYKKYIEIGKIQPFNRPAMRGYQAAGAAPIVLNRIVESPETVASAIRIGNPARWEDAKTARRESVGIIDSVTDEEILEAYALLPRLEQIFCEPASAASVAGLIKDVKMRRLYFDKSYIAVCVLTGHGLKDPVTAERVFTKNPIVVDAKFDAVMDVIKM